MKKNLTLLTTLLCALMLSSCTLTNAVEHSESSGGHESTDTSSSTDKETEQSETETETEEPRTITSVEYLDFNENYEVGNVYKTTQQIKVKVNYSDMMSEFVDPSNIKYTVQSTPNGDTYKVTDPFNRAGEYEIATEITYRPEGGSTSKGNKTFTINVESLLGRVSINSMDLEDLGSLAAGDILANKFVDKDLIYTFDTGVTELVEFDYTDTTKYDITLYKSGIVMDVDLASYTLESGSNYNLKIEDKVSSITKEVLFSTPSNFYRLNADDLSIVSGDLDNSYAPAKGDVSILVIPITIDGDYTETWNEQRLTKVEGCYFDENDPLSLKSYYEEASFNQMIVSGMVSEVYHETDPSLTSNSIEADTSYNKLFQLIDNAVTYIENSHPEINFSDYDLNDDGCLDNVHLITNFNTDTYASSTGNEVWSTPLWPHKYSTGETGTLSKPKANVYSISAIDHFFDFDHDEACDAITAIHEQGHIFGLHDYYDYGYTGADYVGGADMQSHNVFDWNSYSKLTVGWISPYVVRDECEITISAASLNGDCIIVPADESTFNGSGFDEYFLIELFSPYGNNAKFTATWNNYCKVNFALTYGVRLYHVDSRVFKWTGTKFIESADTSLALYMPIDNNCYGYENRNSYFSQFADYKLLTLIQHGGTDTFGKEEADYTHPTYRHYLNGSDLFKQGDTFDFDTYGKFLSKSYSPVTSMDNGETFPYRISFTSMSMESATISIERI